MELVDLTFNNVNDDESELVLKKGENLCLPQGQCVLTVQLNNDDVSRAEGEEPEREEVEEEEEVEFYLLFSGSTQRHVTSTVRVSRVTLQAVCPGRLTKVLVRPSVFFFVCFSTLQINSALLLLGSCFIVIE